MNLITFLLIASQGNANNANATMFLLLGMMLIMYFFFIRPQTQRAKKQRNLIDNLTKGDRIVTIGGIHGKITKVSEQTLLIEVDSGTKLKIEKSSVSVDLTEAVSKAKTQDADSKAKQPRKEKAASES